MSQSYTLNPLKNPYNSGMTTDYATRAFASQPTNMQFNPYQYNPALGQNQSIFSGNNGNTPLTLPPAQPMSTPKLNADGNTQLTLPDTTQRELPEEGTDFEQNEYHP